MFNAIAFAVGLVGFTFVLYGLGWDGMRQAVIGTGAWFGVLAAIDLAGVACDAFAIHAFLRPEVSYWRVLGAQASGLAINRLTPGNSLGEPVKVTMLVRDVPTNLAVSAVVAFNLATYAVAMTAIIVGVPTTALLLDLPRDVAIAAWIAIAVIAVAGAALVVIVRRGAVGTLIDAARRLHLISRARAEAWHARTSDIDARLRALAGIRRGIAGVICSRLFNWTGTVVVLHAADIPLTAPLVVAMLSVGLLVTWMSNVIPLGLGIADGANYALYSLVGASPAAGLLFTMVNRLRTCVLAAMGLAIMAIANRRR